MIGKGRVSGVRHLTVDPESRNKNPSSFEWLLQNNRRRPKIIIILMFVLKNVNFSGALLHTQYTKHLHTYTTFFDKFLT